MAQDMIAEELQKQKELQEQQLRQRAEALHDPELIPLAHQAGGERAHIEKGRVRVIVAGRDFTKSDFVLLGLLHAKEGMAFAWNEPR